MLAVLCRLVALELGQLDWPADSCSVPEQADR